LVVVFLTGAGIKGAGPDGLGPAARIEGRPEELERCLAREGITP
jgi:hypothetical protein